MKKKNMAGKCTVTIFVAGSIFLGSAIAGQSQKITLDDAAIQQAIDQAKRTTGKQAPASYTLPDRATMQLPDSIQQQVLSQSQKNIATDQISKVKLDSVVQEAVAEKMVNMMEKNMQETLSDPTVMQEMQQKIMKEGMASSLLQENIQPMIKKDIRDYMQQSGGKK